MVQHHLEIFFLSTKTETFYHFIDGDH